MRLIDADALKAKLKIDTNTATYSDYCNGYCDARQVDLDAIDASPTIEPEVRHGEWHECWHTDTVCASICTNCGKAATQARVIVGQELMTNVRYPLCPNCGADMRASDTNVGGKGGA